MVVQITRCFEVSVKKKLWLGLQSLTCRFNLTSKQLEVLFLNASCGGSTKWFKFLMTPLLLIHSLFCALKYCHYLYILIAAHNKWSTLRRNSLISKEVPLQKHFSNPHYCWNYECTNTPTSNPTTKKSYTVKIIGQELRNNKNQNHLNLFVGHSVVKVKH